MRGTLACLLLLSMVETAFSDERGPDPDRRDTTRPPRAAVFRAPGFPTVDAPPVPDGTLEEALRGLPVEALTSPGDLAERLRLWSYDVLVLPYGSAFPIEAWPAIRRFVRGGGGLVVLGGAPFHQPVRKEPAPDGRFVLLMRQPTFAREFLIGPAEAVAGDAEPPASLRTAAVAGSGWESAWPEVTRAWALTVRLTRRKDMEGEDGSSGPRDAVLRPLVHVLDPQGVPRLCPLLEVDRLRAGEAGARWVLAATDARLTAPVIREAVRRALQGAVELVARPVEASVDPGNAAQLRITLHRPIPHADERTPDRALVRVRDDSGGEVFSGQAVLQGPAELRTGLIAIRTSPPLPPGLYHVEVETPDAPWHPRSVTTGFWVKDETLLRSAKPLSVSRDWIRRDGRPFPVVGTTYMASDVHRKFLFEPNPHVWDRDFREMSRQGVNLVRTGLWTGWSRAMLDPGAVDENVLSALEAYVQSAARHDIVVCFNFFAFLPPSFSGTNPYLDPRALEGQRALLALFAARFRGVGWIHWDLINEPSYAPPEGLWSNRPIGDPHERRAWNEWIRAKHGDELAVRDAWRDASDDVSELPSLADLNHSFLREDRKPRKARDFDEFSQAVVGGWAARLRDVLKAAGGDVLVTLGQDEGGTGDRPAQQLHSESLDYTAVHTWWNNDDLLWDGVVTKVPEKPNLHQETGIMSLQDIDGNPWRTPEAAARLLERKFAYAFAARGAGVVEWAWNINPFMPVENEATIGFFRPDGTAKPEARVLPALAAFFEEAGPWLDDFAPDPVVLVIPHSRLFAGRPRGVDATKRVVRVLAERFGVVPTALSELRLTSERLRGAKLVLVPAPEMLAEGAARALLEASRAGTRVLVTGALEGDPYGRVSEPLRALGIVDAGRPLALHEATRWGAVSGEGWVGFEGLAQEWLRRSEKPEPPSLTGAVWHEPLPLEFAQETAPLEALLGAALEAAGVETSPSGTRVAARVLEAPRAFLVVCVNETTAPARRRVRVEGRAFDVPVPALRSRLVLVERGTGRVLASTAGEALLPAR
jgi:hypothetical protein